MLTQTRPVGALVASSACRGTIEWGNNASWILPVWLQAMFPGVVWLSAFFMPESPRVSLNLAKVILGGLETNRDVVELYQR